MTLREKAARAIDDTMTAYEWTSDSENDSIYAAADAVIAAIEPAIRADERRKVFEELIAEAEKSGLDAPVSWGGWYFEGVTGGDDPDTDETILFSDWLRSRKEAAGEA